MHEVALTASAKESLKELRKYDRQRIVDAIETHLRVEPTNQARHRKRLRPNQLAEWELRVDDYRVFYDVVEVDRLVKVVAIGYKKGNRLFIRGKEYDL